MKILIVNGSKPVRKKFIRYLELESQFNKVFETDTVVEAKMIMQKEIVDVILFDIQLPGNSGLELVPFSRNQFPKPALILCTNYILPQYLSIYQKMLIDYCFDKSTGLAELKLFIKKLVLDLRNQTQISRNNKSNYRRFQ